MKIWFLILSLLFALPHGTVSADEVVEAAEAKPAKTKKASKKKAKKKAKKKKLSEKDAAFIIVRASFKTTNVTVNDKPYPQNSEIGAVVTPNKTHEVVVTDTSTSTTKRYQVKLKKGEARVFIVDFSAANTPSRPTTSQKKVAEKQAHEKKAGQEEGGFLTVNAQPEGQVYVDGKLVASKTPLVKHELPAGTHTVRVFYVESRKFSKTKKAKISDGRHVNLYFND